ncbi:MAG: outer membrane beta-barrel protein [Saprospiraceae bacterium]
MKKTILVLVSFVFLATAHAQKNDRKFYVGVSLTPQITAQKVNNNAVADSDFATGLALNGDFYLNLHSRLQLKSGLGMQLTRLKQVDYSPLFHCDFAVNGETNLYNSYFDIAITAVYLSIPLNLKLNLTGGRNHLFLDLGLRNAFKLTSKEKVNLYECGATDGYALMDSKMFAPKDYVFSLNAGIGYQASAFSGKTIVLEPMVEYALTPTFQDIPILNNGKMLNIGLMLGVVF